MKSRIRIATTIPHPIEDFCHKVKRIIQKTLDEQSLLGPWNIEIDIYNEQYLEPELYNGREDATRTDRMVGQPHAMAMIKPEPNPKNPFNFISLTAPAITILINADATVCYRAEKADSKIYTAEELAKSWLSLSFKRERQETRQGLTAEDKELLDELDRRVHKVYGGEVVFERGVVNVLDDSNSNLIKDASLLDCFREMSGDLVYWLKIFASKILCDTKDLKTSPNGIKIKWKDEIDTDDLWKVLGYIEDADEKVKTVRKQFKIPPRDTVLYAGHGTYCVKSSVFGDTELQFYTISQMKGILSARH